MIWQYVHCDFDFEETSPKVNVITHRRVADSNGVEYHPNPSY